MYKNSNGYNVIEIKLENEKRCTLFEHKINALLKYSLKEVCEKDVHHKNGCKIDNRLENLELLSHSEHLSHHNKGEKNSMYNPCITIRKRKDKTCKQGYYWVARPYTKDKRIFLSSVNLEKCIKKVIDFINSPLNIYEYTNYKVVR